MTIFYFCSADILWKNSSDGDIVCLHGKSKNPHLTEFFDRKKWSET